MSIGDELRAERVGRRGLAALVDAFLHERRTHADLYWRAHRLGALLCERIGCEWEPGEDQYTLRCPIFALHRPVAHSIAMTMTTKCSICGAGALQCDHLPGETYDGAVCRVAADKIVGGLDHVALTADPDFVYTWHQPQKASVADMLADGIIERVGDRAVCRHCVQCSGEAAEDDLDPVARWSRVVETNMASEE